MIFMRSISIDTRFSPSFSVSEGLDVPAEGQIFRSSEELAQQLQDELKGFPNHQSSATSAVKRETWSEAWQGTVLPIVNKCTE